MEQLNIIIVTVGIVLVLHHSVWFGCRLVSAEENLTANTQSVSTITTERLTSVPADSSNTDNNASESNVEGSNDAPESTQPESTETTTKAEATTTELETTEAMTTTEATTTKKSSVSEDMNVQNADANTSTGVKKEVIVGLSAGFGFGLLLCLLIIIIWNCCCNKLCSDSAAKIMPVDLRNPDRVDGDD